MNWEMDKRQEQERKRRRHSFTSDNEEEGANVNSRRLEDDAYAQHRPIALAVFGDEDARMSKGSEPNNSFWFACVRRAKEIAKR